MNRNCIICKKIFTCNSNSQKICSEKCRKVNNKKYDKYKKEWYKQNRVRLSKYRKNNKKQIKERTKKWRITNKEKIKEYQRKYRQMNKEKIEKDRRIWQRNNKKYFNEYIKNRKKTDINYKLCCILRTRLHHALEKKLKFISTIKLLGCSIEFLKKHLENKFTSKMNWANYGNYWEIDHIRPCYTFNFTNFKQQKECFHYTNLRPLTIIENRRRKRNGLSKRIR